MVGVAVAEADEQPTVRIETHRHLFAQVSRTRAQEPTRGDRIQAEAPLGNLSCDGEDPSDDTSRSLTATPTRSTVCLRLPSTASYTYNTPAFRSPAISSRPSGSATMAAISVGAPPRLGRIVRTFSRVWTSQTLIASPAVAMRRP